MTRLYLAHQLCNHTIVLFAFSILWQLASPYAMAADTLPALKNDVAPQSVLEMWEGFDPRAEALDVEILKEWEQDEIILRVVRFHIGIFKGAKAKLAAVYGFPKSADDANEKLPGLLQIHGGGQYADYKACLAGAKRGYAVVSIAWAGRISAPEYRVSPNEVQLFWDSKQDDPNYRVTTDWGAVDGYHAPSRNAGNQFPSAKAADWTLDSVESPRNSGWFLCALAARRALTFLERQPEVDPNRLGVYGHSMGGKLTVMTAIDPRVKAAAPSCGGISDRDNKSQLFAQTIGDGNSLKRISCPIIFLSPSNDFHGRIDDLPASVAEIKSKQWRVTCSPHHNHQDTPEYEVATMLWMDQHLKASFRFPQTPETKLQLKTEKGTPRIVVVPDNSRKIASVDVFYTTQGSDDESMQDTMTRFWQHAKPTPVGDAWQADLPLTETDKPLWVFANVLCELDEPVSGVGYYYGDYTSNTLNLSSLIAKVSAADLAKAGVRAAIEPSLVIEDFQEDWKKEWFSYRANDWSQSTHKLHAAQFKAPKDVKLSLTLQADEPNKFIILLDEYAAELNLPGGAAEREFSLAPSDFKNHAGEPLPSWQQVRRLKLTHSERLRPARGQTGQPKLVGGNWKGSPPQLKLLRWSESKD
ncbi:MAG: dienelactone hydrolase family protein [Planctomycetota bacterium]